MILKFTKMHGLGNDFMVIDAVNQEFKLDSSLIARLGDRHFGVGFDQLLLVEPAKQEGVDFHYRIFNRDGSEVQMCGNGARCFAKFVVAKGLFKGDTIHVSTVSGELCLKLESDGEVVVNMGVPRFDPEKLPFIADARALRYSVELDPPVLGKDSIELGAVSMGNPHAVVLVDNITTCGLESLGPVLESHKRFPERVNVGFMQKLSSNEVKLRVYERGCGETMACGSGACAAAVVGMNQGLLDSKVLVHLPGGDLTIEWAGEGEAVFMKGPATIVYEGSIEI